MNILSKAQSPINSEYSLNSAFSELINYTFANFLSVIKLFSFERKFFSVRVVLKNGDAIREHISKLR